MKKLIFYFAVIGWILGLTVHILSLDDYDTTAKFPFIWLLHIGIFVVWFPAVYDLTKNEELKTYRQSATLTNSLGFYKIVFRNTPTWLTIIASVGFFYAIINFILFMASQHGSPEIRDGQYILREHGKLIKTLTEQEYHHYRANEVRGFSGHWLAFYGMAAAILFPFTKNKEDLNNN